ATDRDRGKTRRARSEDPAGGSSGGICPDVSSERPSDGGVRRSGGYVQADETPIRCNDPDEKRGGTTQGWLWVISKPGGDVVFDWRLSRRHGELTSLLKDYRGIL